MTQPRTLFISLARGLAALALLGTLPKCRSRAGRPSEPFVDRSDGQLPTLHAAHFERGALRIDGRLDEPAWQRTGSTGPFVDPGSGRPVPNSPVNASARVAWDDEYLYVGAVVYDADPTTPFSPTETDPHLWERSSAIELMIQPGDPGNNTNYYEIQVDPAGAVWDTHFDDYNVPITDEGGVRRFGHQEWVSGIRKAASIDRAAGRYTLEIAIPWSSLRSPSVSAAPRTGDTWRMNFYSFRDGQSQSLAWSPILGRGNFHRASRFGRVIFMR